GAPETEVVDAAGTERDVRNLDVGAPEASVAADACLRPFGLLDRRRLLDLGEEEVTRHRQPATVGSDRGDHAADRRHHRRATRAEERPPRRPRGLAKEPAAGSTHRADRAPAVARDETDGQEQGAEREPELPQR